MVGIPKRLSRRCENSMSEQFGVWEVTGRRAYRGHLPGSTFEARIDVRVAERAIGRGDIRLLKPTQPGIRPGSYTFPRGWLEKAARNHNPPRR